MSLSSDIVEEILKRVDGTTLAKAGCASSDLWAVVKEEGLWEDACNSLWPSTKTEEVKVLVSSLGGFKKFYADCYPLINVYKDSPLNSNKDGWNAEESELDQDKRREDYDLSLSPSDFVSVLDVQWKNRSLYSKVLHGIPTEGDLIDCGYSSLFCPFLINLPGDDSQAMSSWPSSNKDEDTGNKLLFENMRLSWIFINKSTKQAVNLSTWRPLEAHKRWGSDTDYSIRFGSVLPSCSTLPLKLAVCNITLICRIDYGFEESISVGVSEISLMLEDMVGDEVDSKEGLRILQRSVEWRRRSVDQDQVIENCHDLLEMQMDLIEKRIEAEGSVAPMSILVCLLVGVVSYFLA